MVDFGLPNQSTSSSTGPIPTPTPVATPVTQRPSFTGPVSDNLDARQDRHESRSRRTHLLIGLALLLLAVFLGRAAYDNYQLRKGENDLRSALDQQSLKLSQVGDISAYLGEDFVKPGTVLTGPDGQSYICAPKAGAAGTSGTSGTSGAPGTTGASGTAGTAGTAGATGSAGTAGAAGATGAAGQAGQTGAAGPTGATGATGATGPQGPQGIPGDVASIDMDDTYSQFTTAAVVTLDNAEGQGSLQFNVAGGNLVNFDIQDDGTNVFRIDATGGTNIGRELYIGRDDLSSGESIANAGFTIDDNDLYVEGMAGVDGRIFTNTGFTVGASTSYDDGSITTTGASPGAGDLVVVAADDMTLNAGGNDILTVGAVNHALVGPANARIVRLSNVAAAEAADLLVGSSNPSLGGVFNDEGSLFMRDNAGVGELWISDGGGSWRQIATTTGASSATDLDEAYNNFAGGLGGQAIITVDGAQTQGNLRVNLPSTQDFIIQDTGTAFATFRDDGSIYFLNEEDNTTGFTVEKAASTAGSAGIAMQIIQNDEETGLDINQLDEGTALNIDHSGSNGNGISVSMSAGPILGAAISAVQNRDVVAVNVVQNGDEPALTLTSNSTSAEALRINQNASAAGDGIVINQTVPGSALSINDTDTTSAHTAAYIEYDDNATDYQAAGALRVYATNDALDAALVVGDAAPGLIQINTNSETSDSFNFLAFNSDINGGVNDIFRIDEDGDIFTDGAIVIGTPADFAEYFESRDDSLAPGEIVTVDQDNALGVRRTSQNDSPIGVVSTNPGIVANSPEGAQINDASDTVADHAVVALVGQVPVKVNDEAGSILVGDTVAPSSVPGEGKRAGSSDPVVGIALTDAKDGVVQVLLSPRPALTVQQASGEVGQAGALETTDSAALSTRTQQVIAESVDTTDLTVSGTLSAGTLRVTDAAILNSTLSVSGHVAVGADTSGAVTVKAGDKSAEVTFAEPYRGTPHIQLTPYDFVEYRLSSVSEKGFTVELQEEATDEVTFEWLALGSGSLEEPTIQARSSILEPIKKLFGAE